METVSESVLEMTKQIVEQEIKKGQEEYIKKFGSGLSYEKAVKDYLNNFRYKLKRSGEGVNHYRLWAKDVWDTKYSEKIQKQKEKYGEKYREPHISELLKGKTPKDFYEDIDKAALAEGFNLEKLDEEIEQNEETGNLQGDDLAKKILPIYIRLREMGYDHHELIS